MIEIYKILSSLYMPDIAPELAKNVNSVTRGNNLKLLVRRNRLDLRKLSLCERVVFTWNSLPNLVVESYSLNMFKSNFDKFNQIRDFIYNYDAVWQDIVCL